MVNQKVGLYVPLMVHTVCEKVTFQYKSVLYYNYNYLLM